MKVLCQCQAEMVCEEADEAETVRLLFVCPDCRHEVTIAGTAAQAEAALEAEQSQTARPVWTNQARHRLDRIPPFAWPAFQEEAEGYAKTVGCRLITAGLVDEAKSAGSGGQMAWTPEAEQRLRNVPEAVRAMARAEIERMAKERGEATVTETLMDEAKGKFLGFRGQSRPPDM